MACDTSYLEKHGCCQEKGEINIPKKEDMLHLHKKPKTEKKTPHTPQHQHDQRKNDSDTEATPNAAEKRGKPGK